MTSPLGGSPVWRWLAALLIAQGNAALADEWAIDASALAQTRFNDNYELSPAATRNGTAIESLTPDVRFSSRSETRDVNADLSLTANRVDRRPDLNTVDYRLTTAGTWQRERSQWGLAAALNRDSTLQSELSQTGVVQARRQRSNLTLQPYTQYQLDERTSLTASLGGSRVHYANADNTALVDYDDYSGSLGVNRKIDERTALGLQVSREDYRTVRTLTRSQVSGVTASLSRMVSERLRLGFDAGWQRTRTDRTVTNLVCVLGNQTFPIQSSLDLFLCGLRSGTTQVVTQTLHIPNSTPSFTASAAYTLPRGSLSVELGRRLNPSGTGSLLRTDRASLSWRHDWRETISQSVAASTLLSHYTDNAAADVRYTQFAADLGWQYQRDLKFSAGVTLTRQKSAGSNETLKGSEIYLLLNYNCDPLTLSR